MVDTQDCPNTQITRTEQMEDQTAEKVAYLADADRHRVRYEGLHFMLRH